jgi:hypothetical protein
MKSVRERLHPAWERHLERMRAYELRSAKRLPSWRTRQRRRRLALVLLLAVAMMITGAALLDAHSIWIFFALWLGGCLIWIAAWGLLRTLTGQMTSSFSSLLDEREREWRHRVTYFGFYVTIFLMLAAMLYTMIISNQAEGAMRGATMMGALAFVGTTIPTAMLAWTLPDDDPEDLLEESDHA